MSASVKPSYLSCLIQPKSSSYRSLTNRGLIAMTGWRSERGSIRKFMSGTWVDVMAFVLPLSCVPPEMELCISVF